MKLLYCPSCRDLLRLVSYEVRSCTCKKICGKYLKGGRRAVYHGPATLVGIDDRALQGRDCPVEPLWVYPEDTNTFSAVPTRRAVSRASLEGMQDLQKLEQDILDLYEETPLTSREVARALDRNHSAVYRAIKRLVEQGELKKGKSRGSGYRTFMKTE